MYQTITPVNLIRVMLNKYFDAQLPLIPDKHYYNPGYVQYKPMDVTKEVQKAAFE